VSCVAECYEAYELIVSRQCVYPRTLFHIQVEVPNCDKHHTVNLHRKFYDIHEDDHCSMSNILLFLDAFSPDDRILPIWSAIFL
jgi:hypothetical protein